MIIVLGILMVIGIISLASLLGYAGEEDDYEEMFGQDYEDDLMGQARRRPRRYKGRLVKNPVTGKTVIGTRIRQTERVYIDKKGRWIEYPFYLGPSTPGVTFSDGVAGAYSEVVSFQVPRSTRIRFKPKGGAGPIAQKKQFWASWNTAAPLALTQGYTTVMIWDATGRTRMRSKLIEIDNYKLSQADPTDVLKKIPLDNDSMVIAEDGEYIKISVFDAAVLSAADSNFILEGIQEVIA